MQIFLRFLQNCRKKLFNLFAKFIYIYYNPKRSYTVAESALFQTVVRAAMLREVKTNQEDLIWPSHQ